MIKTLITASALCLSNGLFAQLNQGIIVFESKVDMHRGVPEQYKPSIPQFRLEKHQLLFNDSASLYKIVMEDELPDPFEEKTSKSKTMSTSTVNYNTQTYIKHKNKSVIESKDLDGKTYLINKSLPRYEWKLTGETKKILGYLCKKATMVTQRPAGTGWTFRSKESNTEVSSSPTIEVVAWYTEEIPISVGPEEYGQLPGIILQMDIDRGATVFNAVEIKKSLGKTELKEPKKGKSVTSEEFADLRRKAMGGERRVKM